MKKSKMGVTRSKDEAGRGADKVLVRKSERKRPL
jgi:hypothetical protein